MTTATSILAELDQLDPDQRKVALLKIWDRIEDARRGAPGELAAITLMSERKKLTSFKAFVAAAWVHVEPAHDLVWNWHLDVLVEELELAFATPNYRAVFNVPPGTMKSLLVSVFYRAWLWSKNPGLKFLAGSYGSHLSLRDNVKLRDLIKTNWYRSLWPDVRLKGDQNSKERFDTTAGGWSIATSVGGVGTGEHPDYVFVDDPITAQQAESEAELKSANNWLDRTISTRGVVNDVRVILIMQRLHELDPSGHLLMKGSYRHRCFPMRFVPETRTETGQLRWMPDEKDVRTVSGELLWPVLFPERKVRQLEIDLGPFAAAGQLQQNPTPEGGGLFKRGWFEFVDVAPVDVLLTCRGWDTAATDSLESDWTVGVKMSVTAEGIYYVMDVVREQLGPAGVDGLMRATAEMDTFTTIQREHKDPAAAGISAIAAHVKLMAGFDYAGSSVSGSKLTRARPFRAQCEGRNVRIVRGSWNDEFIRELEGFPLGAKDDQVDAAATAFNSLISELPPLEYR